MKGLDKIQRPLLSGGRCSEVIYVIENPNVTSKLQSLYTGGRFIQRWPLAQVRLNLLTFNFFKVFIFPNDVL
jgi:hypothetical protein